MKKILILSNFLPYKKTKYIAAGYNMTLEIIDDLYKAGYEVDFISLINPEQYLEKEEYSNNSIKKLIIFEITKLKKIINIVLNIFKPILCSVRFDYRIKSELKKIQNDYDVIILDCTQNIAYIKYLKKFIGKKILIEQDIAYQAYERKFKIEKNKFKKLFFFIEYKRLKRYEERLIEKYDVIIVPSKKDFNLIKTKNNNIEILKPFFHRIKLEKKENIEEIKIGFLGAMNRKENEEAVIWFLQNIWLEIYKKYGNQIKFYIIGSNPGKELKKEVSKYKGVIVTGYVSKIEDYFSKLTVGVVPLLRGAGVKIKTVEMLYSEIPIVSTSIGVEGINVTDGKEFLLADSREAFKRKIEYLLENKSYQNMIKKNLKKNKNKLLVGKSIIEILNS